MLTSYNINYPLINQRISGLHDLQIIFWGYRPGDTNSSLEILSPYISEVKINNDIPVIEIVLPFIYNGNNAENVVINASPGMQIDSNRGITTTITADTAVLRNSITQRILEQKSIFTPITGAIEPCNVIYAFSYKSNIIYKINDETTLNELPAFGENVSCTTEDDVHYIINGESPVFPTIPVGIKSINGITGGSLDLTVSQSLIVENNYSESTINVRSK